MHLLNIRKLLGHTVCKTRFNFAAPRNAHKTSVFTGDFSIPLRAHSRLSVNPASYDIYLK